MVINLNRSRRFFMKWLLPLVLTALSLSPVFAQQTVMNIAASNIGDGQNRISFTQPAIPGIRGYRVYSSSSPISDVTASGVRCLSDLYFPLYIDGKGIGGWTSGPTVSIIEQGTEIHSGTKAIRAFGGTLYNDIFAFNWNQYMGVNDLTKATGLVMWVKGETGGQSFNVNFVCGTSATKRVLVGGITTSWQRIEIPISQFLATNYSITNFKRCSELVVTLDNMTSTPSGTLYFDDVYMSKMVSSNESSFTYGDPATGALLDTRAGQYFAVTIVSNSTGGENRTISVGNNTTTSPVHNTPTKTLFTLDKYLAAYQGSPPFWSAVPPGNNSYIRLPYDSDGNGTVDKYPELVVATNLSYDRSGAVALAWNVTGWGSLGIGDPVSSSLGKDVSAYDTLVFWVKGLYLDYDNWDDPGVAPYPISKPFSVSIQTREGMNILGSATFDLSGTEWKKVSIPFENLGNAGLGMDGITYFIINFSPFSKGVILLDKIAVERNADRIPAQDAFKVVSVSPANGSKTKSLRPVISIRFSHPLRSLGSAVRIMNKSDNTLFMSLSQFTPNERGDVFTIDLADSVWTNSSGLIAGKEYQVQISSNATDIDGRTLGTTYTWNFTAGAISEVENVRFVKDVFNPDLETENALLFTVSDPALSCKVTLYSSAGQPVASYGEDASTKGTSTAKKVRITGKDSDNKRLAPGIYVVGLAVKNDSIKIYKTVVIK